MSRWYRAYEGTTTDSKIGEAALVSGCSRSVVIATWHSILESCAGLQDRGRFDVTPRRVAASLGETPELIEKAFAAFEDVGMTAAGVVCAWSKRQFESDNSTQRSRKHRATRGNGDATLHQPRETSLSVSASVSVDNEEVEFKRLEDNPARAREPDRFDAIRDTLSTAAGEAPCAVDPDISPIVRLLDAGWSMEGHILPGLRDLVRRQKRPGTWKYVAITLEGRAADIRAGPPPDDSKPETASQRFARKQKAAHGDPATGPREIYPAA